MLLQMKCQSSSGRNFTVPDRDVVSCRVMLCTESTRTAPDKVSSSSATPMPAQSLHVSYFLSLWSSSAQLKLSYVPASKKRGNGFAP